LGERFETNPEFGTLWTPSFRISLLSLTTTTEGLVRRGTEQNRWKPIDWTVGEHDVGSQQYSSRKKKKRKRHEDKLRVHVDQYGGQRDEDHIVRQIHSTTD
jgi:hypothetical protein